MKIVIVEDDPGIRKELKQLLENAFYEAEIIEEFKDTAEQICSMIPALPEDPLPVLLAVPHLAQQKGVKAFALELVAFHHHQLHRAFAILKFRDMTQGGKAGHLFITAETLYGTDVLFHHSGHLILVRHIHRLFEQHLNEIGAAGLGAFFVIQVLLEHLIAHSISSL